MLKNGKIWIAINKDAEDVYMLPGKATNHGLIAGGEGTGKTVTMKVLAESFSELGVPVFMSDVKGDLAGLMAAGTDSADMQARIQRFGLNECGFAYEGFPVTLWDAFGKRGIPMRSTISEMGPILLGYLLDLNELQRNILSIAFRIADENSLLLVDTKDLKALLNYVSTNAKEFEAEYGKISAASVSAIVRSIVALEGEGGELFFSDPALNVQDFLTIGMGGKGMINLLDAQGLVGNARLYGAYMLWLLSELYEMLPEVGEVSKPKMAFFFDDAQIMFGQLPSWMLEKVVQILKAIGNKGVAVFFSTKLPKDIPADVLALLGNKIQHGLSAYTPAEQKAAKSAADAFRANPEFKTLDIILALEAGEAVASFIDENGAPAMCDKVTVLPPKSRIGAVADLERERSIKESLAYSRYANAVDPDSAYEFLQRKGLADAEAAEAAKAKAAEEKEAAKAAEKEAKEAEKKSASNKKAVKSAAKSVSSSVAGTIGREAGKALGSSFGSFGKTLGGNVGAALGRGIIGTLFGLKK